MKQSLLVALILTFFALAYLSCKTPSSVVGPVSLAGLSGEDRAFLEADENAEELFRVFLSSDNYAISQMKHIGSIERVADPVGDRYMRNAVRSIDMIDETREGTLSIILFPDSGKVMKVRPKKSTYIMEIDKIITEDMQRWIFSFPGNVVDPTKFDIRYRVKLVKRQSDEEIMREVRESMRQSQ
jgi:hypothetical protein